MSDVSDVFSHTAKDIREFRLDDNTYVILINAAPGLARLSFVNKEGESIDIPLGFYLRDITNEAFGEVVEMKPIANTKLFCLAWNQNYEFGNGRHKYRLTNQKRAVEIL